MKAAEQDRVPSVFEQGLKAAAVGHDPAVRRYNSGMAQVGKHIYIATRTFNPGTHRCDIEINRIIIEAPGRCRPSHVATVDLPRATGMEQFEDGRLLHHRGRLYLAYTEGRYWRRPYVAVQQLALFRKSSWEVEKVWTIGYGNNSVRSEKNWQFFSDGERLHFIYSISPHVVVSLDDEMRVTGEQVTTPTLHWEHGTLSGGTPPVPSKPAGDTYITFFHSYTPHAARSRRYTFSAYEFSAKPPYAIRRLTRPLIVASARDGTLPNPSEPRWLPIVVFPCGAILDRAGNWLVSAG
ncbi:MAG: hypothetical protein KIT44_13540, partial [Opitutaceae bacterium]|nr:hypothetical protein [Opitutaceae bacterium]